MYLDLLALQFAATRTSSTEDDKKDRIYFDTGSNQYWFEFCLDHVSNYASHYTNTNTGRGYLHDDSTVSYTTKGRPITVKDDYHVTVRMGTSEDICNLHGHLYIHRDEETKMPIRMMKDDERTVVLGKARELRVWGWYPPESKHHPRLGGELPVWPDKWQRKDGQRIKVNNRLAP